MSNAYEWQIFFSSCGEEKKMLETRVMLWYGPVDEKRCTIYLFIFSFFLFLFLSLFFRVCNLLQKNFGFASETK